MNIPPEKLEICLAVLQQISEEPTIIGEHERLKSLIAKIHKEGRKIARSAEKKHQRCKDRQLKETTEIVKGKRLDSPIDRLPNFTASLPHFNKSVPCYICKKSYQQIHFFYHSLCPECADFNYQKRYQRTNLNGRIALVTGGRIKIGYQIVLRLLQDGARVIVTTRFPRDCAHRYSLEPDCDQWRDRLHIYGLDLRNISAVEAFINHLLHTEPALDILINNAAQTIKRPLGFYQHLLEEEQKSSESLSETAKSLIPYHSNSPTFLLESQPQYQAYLPVIEKNYFPPGTFDGDGQQLDTRPLNSWLLKLDEVSTIELLEVQLVNAIAPFILNSKLKQLMMKSSFERRFIINVSAMEGQFNRNHKTPYHPHTNMAKAALNMMTRTAAIDYGRDRIFMNSVDTGWITDENPYPKKTHLQTEQGFYTPLDIIDGMARIYDPIVQGIESIEQPIFGYFLKDYIPYAW